MRQLLSEYAEASLLRQCSLASDDSKWITGETLLISGGLR